MSYSNFEKGQELAKQCEGYDISGKSDETIMKASKLLNIKFSKQTYKYFNEIGYLDYFGSAFLGIIVDDFSGAPADNCVETALAERAEYNLPEEWLPIYDFDDGEMGYLDYSQLNDEGEPPVIIASYNGEEYVVIERFTEDLGDLILMMVEEDLEIQQQEQ